MKRFIAIAAAAAIASAYMRPSPALAEKVPGFDREAFIASAEAMKTLKLTKADCVSMALVANSEIQIRRIVPLIQGANVLVQRAKFEPEVTFDFDMADNQDISSSKLVGETTSKTRTGVFDFGYEQLWTTGTLTRLDFFNTRTFSNSQIQSMNPTFDSVAEATVTQHLLKGFGIEVNKADYLIAKNNKKRSQKEFAEEVMKILTEAKKKYYEYQYSLEQYKVAETAVRRVKNLYEINKERYLQGLASDIDIAESEAEVARMEQALLASEEAVEKSQDDLKFVTNLVDDPEFWNAKIIPSDMLSYRSFKPALTEAILTAFDHRPDYEAARIELNSRDISVVFYRNGMLPTLDLIGSFGLNGLGKNYEKDLGNIGGGKYQNWSLGARFVLPLGSEKEKGEYEKSKFEKEQVLIAFKRLEQKIILEVRNAVRNIDIEFRVLEASKKSMEAESKNYRAQEERFKVGLVSMLDMVIYQERLAKAEVNFARSVVDYNVYIIELARAQGMTLINENIILE